MGCSDCQEYAREIANTLRSVKGWENLSFSNWTMISFGEQKDIHIPASIEIHISDTANLNVEQKILIDAFKDAGIALDLIKDSLRRQRERWKS